MIAVLALFERRGIPIELHGVERLIAACARNDAANIHFLNSPSEVAAFVVDAKIH